MHKENMLKAINIQRAIYPDVCDAVDAAQSKENLLSHTQIAVRAIRRGLGLPDSVASDNSSIMQKTNLECQEEN